MRSAAIVGLCMALAIGAGCTPKVAARPTTPGQPAPDGPAAWAEAMAPCKGLDTDAPVMQLAAGRIGGRRVSGVAVLPALTVRNEVRLSASYGGRSLFTLSGALERALLELPPLDDVPREHVIARADEIVAVLIGLRVEPVDLLRAITGCVAAGDPAIGEPARHGSLIAIRTKSATVYLQQRSGRWRLALADLPALQIDYRAHAGDWPSDVVLSSVPASAEPATVRLRIQQHNINSPELLPAAFVVRIPPGSREITLDDLRRRLGSG